MRLLASEMGRAEARSPEGPSKLQVLQGLLASIPPAPVRPVPNMPDGVMADGPDPAEAGQPAS